MEGWWYHVLMLYKMTQFEPEPESVLSMLISPHQYARSPEMTASTFVINNQHQPSYTTMLLHYYMSTW